MCSVHPHVHGERYADAYQMLMNDGSSPRTWGTLAGTKIDPRLSRFIPTYMGNALSSNSKWNIAAVHPHVHGERYSMSPGYANDCGSSPRTWGTHRRRQKQTRRRRFIPTYMGNASAIRAARIARSVHPHVHGERYKIWIWIDKGGGSSPRTWGTPG